MAAVIGGSLGGMATLEWPLCTPLGYVRTIIPITTSSWQSAWGISWNEAQKEAIRGDRDFQNGWYTPLPEGQPLHGLGAARMIGMLTYRSYQSFEARFHRGPAKPRQKAEIRLESGLPSPPHSEDGNDNVRSIQNRLEQDVKSKTRIRSIPRFSAQSYMQYQADKFLQRFDANCYISMLDKMDSHDITLGRIHETAQRDSTGPGFEQVREVLKHVPPGALVVSVESDVLFRNDHQMQLAQCLPEAEFVNLDSDDGHDGFLLEFEALAYLIIKHLRQQIPSAYEADLGGENESMPVETITSVFGETEPEF